MCHWLGMLRPALVAHTDALGAGNAVRTKRSEVSLIIPTQHMSRGGTKGTGRVSPGRRERAMWKLLGLLLVSAVALGVGQPHPDRQLRAAERVPPPVDRTVQPDDRAKPLPRHSAPRPSTAPAAVPRRQLLWPAGTKIDKSSNCVSWADQGECEKNPGFMQSDCAATCSKRPQDTLGRSECVSLSERGGCRSRRGAILTMATLTVSTLAAMGFACLCQVRASARSPASSGCSGPPPLTRRVTAGTLDL